MYNLQIKALLIYFMFTLHMTCIAATKPLFVLDASPSQSKQKFNAQSEYAKLNSLKSIVIKTPEHKLVNFLQSKIITTESGKTIWFGNNGKYNSVNLIQSNLGISGSIRVNGEEWRVSPKGKSSYAINKYQRYPEENDIVSSDKNDVSTSQRNKSNTSSIQNTNSFKIPSLAGGVPSGFSDENDIRILFFYPSEPLELEAELLDWIELDLAEANLALENSSVEARYIMAGLIPIDPGFLGYDVFGNEKVFKHREYLREKYQADLLHLIAYTGTACGEAELAVYPDGLVDPTQVNAYTAPGCLGRLVMAHEIGHNLGAYHDRYSYEGGVEDEFNYGYVDVENEFRTVMAYTSECRDNGVECTRVAHYSNPDVLYENAVTGIAFDEPEAADNVAVFSYTANIVSNFIGVGYPANLIISKGTEDGQVTLQWDALPGAHGYEVIRNPLIDHCNIAAEEAADHFETESTSYIDTSGDDQQYCYWVRAYRDHAYNARNYSSMTPFELGYPFGLAATISMIPPQLIDTQESNTILFFDAPNDASVSANIVTSNANDWLEVETQLVSEGKFSLNIKNTKNISAKALIQIEVDGIFEYVPIEYTGYSNQAPNIQVPQLVTLEAGSFTSFVVAVQDELKTENLSIYAYSMDTDLISHQNITSSDQTIFIESPSPRPGEAEIVVVVSDGEHTTKQSVKIEMQRVQHNLAIVPEEVILYVDSSGSLRRLLPGYDVDEDPLTYEISRQPKNGTLTLLDDEVSFEYFTKSPMTEDSFTLLVTETDSNTEFESTVTIKPLTETPVILKYNFVYDSYLTAALLSNKGELWIWGKDPHYVPDHVSYAIPVPTKFDNQVWADVSMQDSNMFLIKNDGTLWAIGNDSKEFPVPAREADSEEKHDPVQVGNDTDWRYFIKSDTYKGIFLLVKADGSLWIIGNDRYYRFFSESRIFSEPQQLNGLYHWEKGDESYPSIILQSSDQQLWTATAYREESKASFYIGREQTINSLAPIELPEIDVKGYAVELYRSYLITENEIYTWGDDDYEYVEPSEPSGFTSDRPIKVRDHDWSVFDVGWRQVALVDKQGQLWTAGKDREPKLPPVLGRDIDSEPYLTQVGSDTDWVYVWAGAYATFALKNDGSFWSVGENNYILGYESDENVYEFTEITTLSKTLLNFNDIDADDILDFMDDDITDIDTDGDGIGNKQDTDDDNDGVLDTQDDYPLDSTRSKKPVSLQSETTGSGSGGGSMIWLSLLLIHMFRLRHRTIN